MRLLSTVLVLCLASNGLSAAEDDELKIDVLDGHGSTVTLESGRAADIRLRVTDRENKPISGAYVSAILPGMGPGGHFSGGMTIATKESDSDGRVAFSGIHLRKVTGDFTTQIRARRGDRTGAAQVTQKVSNASTADETFFSRRHILMMAIAGAGVAAGVAAAIVGHSDGPAAPPLTVTPGTPTTGGPR